MLWQLIVLLVLVIPILAIVLDSQLGQALADRVRRRELGGDTLDHERMAFLEGEVERLASEIHRLDEESQFLHKLLAERAGADPPPRPEALPRGEDDDAPA